MDLFSSLNQEQKDAVETVEGALLVLAGAGSGKTRVVTYRIVHLIRQGILPEAILGLTFTNKAAKEMKERIRSLTESHVLISTFHSIGARILRESIDALGFRRDFTIYDVEDVDKVLRACLTDAAVDKKMEPKLFRNLISAAKNDLRSPDQISLNETPPFKQIYGAYQAKLKEYNALDFDDLLYLTVKLFQTHPHILEHYQNRWKFLLIDEYQDTNAVQYELVRLLVAKSGNICVVGDPDQSIYSWRGADISNILDFENDYPGAKVIRLEQNYRSRSNILNAANAVIGHNYNRYDKQLWSDLGPGEKIKHFTAINERGEAEFVAERIWHHHHQHNIPFHEIVVFYRTNAQSRAFEDIFLQKRLPYSIVGGISFYQRREIKDILAFLRMVHSGNDFVSFERTINIPKRGLGDTTIDRIRSGAYASNLSVLSYCEAIVEGFEMEHPLKLTAKQKTGLTDYVHLIRNLKKIGQNCSLKELVQTTIEQSGYLEHLQLDPETNDERKENLDALIAKANEWEISVEHPSLSQFLEELSLRSSLDEAEDDSHVHLMTIHNGKGLEFSVAFLVGMEEDLFPHVNSREAPEAVEEERRLFYVGMTRAKEFLYTTNTVTRFMWGTSRNQRTSRFLREIPFEYSERIRLFNR